MSLAIRIVPQLLMRDRQLVKGSGFNAWRSVGMVTQAVRIHQMREVDELMLLDVAATPEARGPDLSLISELAEIMFSPLTVGGGIRSVKDVTKLLNNGADKVCIGTAAMADKRFLCDAVDMFGSSTIVVAIDYKYRNDVPLVHLKCGSYPTLVRPEQAARQMEECGAGEIVLTCIDREGTMAGYDLEVLKHVAAEVDIPVVASGGCADYADMLKAVFSGASAVSAGAMFQFTDSTPQGAAAYLEDMGMEVRCN